MGQLPFGEINLIENIEDAKKYNNKSKKNLAYVTQTTLSVDDTKEIINVLKNKFPNIVEPNKEDSLSLRLYTIFTDIEELINTYSTTIISIEEIFYGVNVKFRI